MTADDDRLRQLESDLRAFRPQPLTPETSARLGHALSSRPQRATGNPQRSIPDRLLAATLTLASLAACLIVALLLYQFTPTPVPTRAAGPPNTPTLANPQPLLARADFTK